jgi:hypothetical protein
MKTDAEYLTEHVVGRYVCPCGPKPKRAKYRRNKDRPHTHATLDEICACMATYMDQFIVRKVPYTPPSTLAQAISDSYGFGKESSLHAVVWKIIKKKELFRCRTVRELRKKLHLITPEMRKAEERFKEAALAIAKTQTTEQFIAAAQAAFKRIS